MTDTKMCPYCGEDVKLGAIKCKHCHSMLSEEDNAMVGAAAPIRPQEENPTENRADSFFTGNSLKSWMIPAVVAIILVYLFMRSGIFDTLNERSSDGPTVDVVAVDEEPATRKTPESAKNAFIAWESEIMLIHARADNAMEAFTSVLNELGEGNVDIYSTYNEAKKTRDIVNIAWRDLNRVEIGDELSDDHKGRLGDATDALSTGLFVKVEGLDLILKFLDDPKPSYINEATGNFEIANIYMFEGLSEITVVKSELGLLDELNGEE
jgi:hypothetical protein